MHKAVGLYRGDSMKIETGRDVMVLKTLGYVFIFLFGFMCVMPFVLIVVSSFSSEASILHRGYTMIPEEISLDAYRWVFRNPGRIFRAYINTIGVTVAGTAVALLMVVMGGYVLARPDFSWRNVLSFFFFFTTLFSGGLVPWYIICTQYLGFKNSYLALFMPPLFSVWNLIVCKNFMKSIPYEITESAKVDGANDIRIFYSLILPLVKPLLATIGMFIALAYWNDWYNALLFITDKDKQSLQAFLQDMLQSANALKQMASSGQADMHLIGELPSETMKMAMTCVVTGPIIFVYPFVQKYFVKGLSIGAVKG